MNLHYGHGSAVGSVQTMLSESVEGRLHHCSAVVWHLCTKLLLSLGSGHWHKAAITARLSSLGL